MKKNSLFIFLSGLFLIIFLVGCASNSNNDSSENNESVEISFLTHWDPPTAKKLEGYTENYMKENPNVNISVNAVPFGDLLTTLSTQSQGENAPTMSSVFNLWLPDLVNDEFLAPVPDENIESIEENYPDSLVDGSSIDGDIYGYPNEVNLYALNYNQELFDEAGIDSPPETWEELKEDAKTLTKEEEGQQGFGVITNWDSGVVHPWLAMLRSNGGELISDNQEPLLDTKETERTIDFYYDLIFNDKSTDTSMSQANDSTTGPYLNNFANGKTGMIIMANWWKEDLESAMGDKFENVKTAPIPVGPDGDSSKSLSYSWSTIVNNNSTDKQQKAAWEFLDWLNSPDSGENGSSAMGEILISMGILPSRDSDIDAHNDKLDDEFTKTYIEELDNAEAFPIVRGGNELQDMIQKQIEKVMLDEQEPEEAMKETQSQVEKLMEEKYSD